MKLSVVFALLVALILTGCKGKGSKPTEGESKADSARNEGRIEMSVSAQQHVGMVVQPAQVTQLNEYLRTTGTVQPIDSRVGIVGPLARGRIAEVKAKVGDRVSAGQVLAVFDNIEAGELLSEEQAARADLERLKAQLVPAARQAERSRRLADIGAGSEKNVQASQAEENGIEASVRSQETLLDGIRRRMRRFCRCAN